MTEDEFDLFYTAAYPRLVGQLYALTGSHAEAQDVVQEAFIRAWDRRSSVLNGERDPEAWIRTVAHRLAMSR
ncbi:sigma factor, partial [Streptomyces sp. NPDC047022]|uniref:sigma factor n=1 Tax=Streptomyces sp. NPDC047022 TaxID=3155737 RepID=UPI0033D3F960